MSGQAQFAELEARLARLEEQLALRDARIAELEKLLEESWREAAGGAILQR